MNSSRFAEFAGIPIAVFGFLAYLLILGLLLMEKWKPEWQEGLQIGEFGVTFVGAIYSIYLTYIEVAVLKAICPFCVVSTIAMISLFITSIIRLSTLVQGGEQEEGGS